MKIIQQHTLIIDGKAVKTVSGDKPQEWKSLERRQGVTVKTEYLEAK